MSLMSDAILVGGMEEDENTYFAVTVINKGNLPTTITHMVIYDYGTLWRRLLRKVLWQGIVPRPNSHGHDIPYVLEPGQQWHGQVRSNIEDLAKRRDSGWLYVGVCATHHKRAFLARVPKAQQTQGGQTLPTSLNPPHDRHPF